MKLSEAIRLGSLLRPQAFNSYFNGTGTCAMGAALEAVGIPIGQKTMLFSENQWPGISIRCEYTSPCDCGSMLQKSFLITVITHLNDKHHWTRERIADWVASVEPSEDQTVTTSAQPSLIPVASK